MNLREIWVVIPLSRRRDWLGRIDAELVMSCIDDFQDFCRGRSINLPNNSNTVFQLCSKEDDPNEYTCEYYIADHNTRSVFWLDVFEASWVPTWSMVKGVTNAGHVGKWFCCTGMFTALKTPSRARHYFTVLVSLPLISKFFSTQCQCCGWTTWYPCAFHLRYVVSDGLFTH